MILKDVHLYIMYAVTFGQLDEGFANISKHHVSDLQDNGYLKSDLSLTDKGRMAIDFATKKAGEI